MKKWEGRAVFDSRCRPRTFTQPVTSPYGRKPVASVRLYGDVTGERTTALGKHEKANSTTADRRSKQVSKNRHVPPKYLRSTDDS